MITYCSCNPLCNPTVPVMMLLNECLLFALPTFTACFSKLFNIKCYIPCHR